MLMPRTRTQVKEQCVKRELKTTDESLQPLEYSVKLGERGSFGGLHVVDASQPFFNVDGSNDSFLLRVHAVGLNFRDVLNVLGEYPGDPGPPGGDCAGAVVAACKGVFLQDERVFGLASG